MSYVAAFRVHRWDQDIAGLAERFFAAFPPAARKVVIADETRGPIDVPYEKVSHTERTGESLGLPTYPPGDVLWYCGDYALYFLVAALPDYDHYVLSEYDVAVNLSLEPMMAEAAWRPIDIMLQDIQPSTPDWDWHEIGSKVFPQPWRCLMFFMVASRRAAQALLQVRQVQAAAFASGELQVWPYCETFIPSVLKAMPDMQFEEVGAFVEASALRFRPRMSCSDPRTSAPGSMAHPVLGSTQFIPAMLKDRPPGEYFEADTELSTGFKHERFEDFVEPLGRALLRRRDHIGLNKLRQEIAARGLPPPSAAGDLALNKPALSSSTSDWSDHRDPGLDARGANSEWRLDEYGFHTADEHNPWWMVDLLEAYVVDRVEILNRPTHSERVVKFRIESSFDANVWITRFAKIDALPVSSLIGAPWRRVFADPFVARYVRITLLESRMLHLRQVHVFGRAIGSIPSLVCHCESNDKSRFA